jgi:molybdopterin molybdotransferase
MAALDVAEAVARVMRGVGPLGVERVLAEPLVAPLTLPQWTNSAMDGYAVRAADVRGATADRPVRLVVIETVMAGGFPTRSLGAGEATRIMTGAPVPEGADSVVRVEDSDDGRERVEIRDDRDAAKNLRPAGEDMRVGDLVLAAGTLIGPGQVGVLASCGMREVSVYRRARVAIVGSGDELVTLDRYDEVLAGRRIAASNNHAIAAAVRGAGGEPVDLGVTGDNVEALRERMSRAAGCDLVITTAGASVGESDFTRAAVLALGGETLFWRVRMRPGAPVGFGTVLGMPWLGLPGNPVSALVTFELFARPMVRRMGGHAQPFRRAHHATLAEPVRTGARLTHFLRARLTYDDGGAAVARLTGPQGSGILTSMATADALIVVPHDVDAYAAGDVVITIPLGEGAAYAAEFAL